MYHHGKGIKTHRKRCGADSQLPICNRVSFSRSLVYLSTLEYVHLVIYLLREVQGAPNRDYQLWMQG